MSLPTDPALRAAEKTTRHTISEPCPWCLGAGKYFERLDVDVGNSYLPMVCEGCMGTGHRAAA